ncbi:hypothetical protein GWI33_001089 [Rhynchophorus ferrugineus]|uniref:NACHT domain-containing protein n=1 Tax=Rhynchophorus ferrugineus TaxID=354439 RepID=A0A834INN8_RHYFE|nr:hypothetical protein GWI33_001089 [Rhynchophorus ferrugineus]
MKTTECLALRYLDIHIKKNVFSLYSMVKNIQKIANIIALQIHKGERAYDMVLYAEKNNKRYGVYIECLHSNKYDNEAVDLRLFLDKYYQRVKTIAIDAHKILMYSTVTYNSDDWLTLQNLNEEDLKLNNDTSYLILNETVIQNLLLLYNREPRVDKRQYTAFLEKIHFLNYDIYNCTQESLPFLGPKTDRFLMNAKRTNLIVLQNIIKHFKIYHNTNINNFNEQIHLNKTCEGLSTFNVNFLNRLDIMYGKSIHETWEPIFNDHSIHVVFVDTNSTLLSVERVIQFISYKGLSFLLLSAQQLRVKDISKKAYQLLLSGNIEILIIEIDHETKKDDNPLSISTVQSMKKGKIIHISSTRDTIEVYTRRVSKKSDQRHLQNTNKDIKYISETIKFSDFHETTKQNMPSAKIMFQEVEMNLENITNLATIEICLNNKDLEDLIIGWDFHVGREIKFYFDGPVYLQRTIRRKIIPDNIFKTHLANSSLVIIFGGNLQKLNIQEQKDAHVNSGIIMASDRVEALNTFQRYCKQLNTTQVYLVEYKNGLFFLENCKTFDMKIVNYLEDFPHSENITTDDLLSRNQTNLIIGNPGVGKSCFLNHLAIQCKNKIPNFWIVYVNLGNNSSFVQHIFNIMEKYNFKSDIQNSVVELLMPIVISSDPENKGYQFARELFKLGFERSADKCKFPNYIFLFDAFDELIEKHQKKAISLFRFLMSKNFTLWITSRSHHKRRLEEDLKTVALSINPLLASQKDEYLQNYYKWSSIKMSYEDFYFRMESLLLYLDSNISVFTDYPLHLEFLTVSNGSLNELYDLLKRYFHYKCDLYYRQKIPPKGFRVTKQENTLLKLHTDIALSMYGLISKVHSKVTQDELLRIGLMTLEDNKLTFIHGFLKACFLASYVIRNKDREWIGKIITEEKYKIERAVLNSTTALKEHLIDTKCWTITRVAGVIKNLTNEGYKNLGKLINQSFFCQKIDQIIQ